MGNKFKNILSGKNFATPLLSYNQDSQGNVIPDQMVTGRSGELAKHCIDSYFEEL